MKAVFVLPAQLFHRILSERGVEVLCNSEVVDVASTSELVITGGRRVPFTECLWCTPAAAQPWLRNTELALDDEWDIGDDEF